MDADQVDLSDIIEPAGDRMVAIVDSTLEAVKPPKTGAYIKFKLQILDGPQKGRIGFWNVTVDNPNAKAVEIGRKDLARIGKACKKPRFADTTELHRIPFMVFVAVDQDDQGKKNNFRQPRPVASAVAETVEQVAQQVEQSPQTTAPQAQAPVQEPAAGSAGDNWFD